MCRLEFHTNLYAPLDHSHQWRQFLTDGPLIEPINSYPATYRKRLQWPTLDFESQKCAKDIAIAALIAIDDSKETQQLIRRGYSSSIPLWRHSNFMYAHHTSPLYKQLDAQPSKRNRVPPFEAEQMPKEPRFKVQGRGIPLLLDHRAGTQGYGPSSESLPQSRRCRLIYRSPLFTPPVLCHV